MPPIDPLRRWREHGEKPDFAGLLTFGGAPFSEDPADLEGVDVAIVGAPTDDLVSDRPGARFAPRAIRAASCPPGPHLAAHVDAFAALRVLDYGDAPVLPADPRATHAAIERTVGEVVAAGAIPVVLGGDHATSEPSLRAVAAHHGALGLIHFDAHADTGDVVFGTSLSHGTPMRHLLDDGLVEGARYAQLGLRGYWPGDDVFAWQRERGVLDLRMHELRAEGVAACVEHALDHVGDGPVYLTVDIDVLEPGLIAAGTGTPEPGGMDVGDLLDACRAIAQRCDLVGADVVEVIPTAVGSADPAALAAERIVREVLTGIALRRHRG